MVTFLVIYERPTDPAEFDRHYFDVHLPLAKRLPGLRNYSVSRNLAAVRGEAPYLVCQLEWDDLESLRRDFGSALGRQCADDVDALSTLCAGGVRSVIFETEVL